ncbi:MAG: hypothetical protein OEW95_03645 [Candidatus Bathyarchaeota archaeon]|nr:hypothetical protein [Candidatus Bathyarchaeota archaeon]
MSSFLKASLLVLMVLLCLGVPIVGAEGVVVLSWTSPTTADLLDVFMVGSSDGWAVGRGGTIIRWDGTDWSTVTSPTTKDLYEVFMVSTDDGWAVGWGGTIICWDGTSWSNVTSPTTGWLNSVFMVSPDDGWAVGEYGTIIRWTGTEWIPEFPTAILMSLLISLPLVAVIIAKITLKRRRSPSLQSKTRL